MVGFPKRRFLVLGMHRSGTSVTANILVSLGVAFGDDLLGASHANPLGHFEDKALIRLNELILRRAGGCWDAPPSTERIQAVWPSRRDEIHYRLMQIASSGCAIAVKDPRICLLLRQYLALEFFDAILLVTRNECDIVKSLSRRNGFKDRYSKRLVKHYQGQVATALEDCDLPILTLRYEELSESPAEVSKMISDFLRLPTKSPEQRDATAVVLKDGELARAKENARNPTLDIISKAVRRPLYAVEVLALRVQRFIRRLVWWVRQ